MNGWIFSATWDCSSLINASAGERNKVRTIESEKACVHTEVVIGIRDADAGTVGKKARSEAAHGSGRAENSIDLQGTIFAFGLNPLRA